MTREPIDVSAYFAQRHAQMVGWRRHLHRIPELAFTEHKTARFVADRLASWGMEVHTGLAGTGVVGIVGSGDGPSIGLRADMDALAIEESTDAEPRSEHPGVMHACGHDAHTTMLLGAARYFTDYPPSRGRVVLIFQPAEEGGGGAAALIRDGLFERFPVDAVFGLHNVPVEPGALDLPAGTIATRAGPVLAAFDSFDIVVSGAGGHSSMPQQSENPILVASEITVALHTIIGSDISPFDEASLAVCVLRSGASYNVVPDRAELKGSLRYFDAQVGERIRERIRTVASAAGYARDITVTVDVQECYPVTINDAGAADIAARAASAATRKQVPTFGPLMGSEDFSILATGRPGAMSVLGIGDESGPVHSPSYRFNDDVLPVGAEFWVRLVEVATEPVTEQEPAGGYQP